MEPLPLAVIALAQRLEPLTWVSDLLVAGSLATGDHVPEVSDLDLVAVTAGSVDEERAAQLVAIHAELDHGAAAGTDLGCVYVDERGLLDPDMRHPTWTHGTLTRRILSGITRAALVRHGFEVFGRSPADLLPPMSENEIRAAARAELCGYWAWAVRRPHLWLDPRMADLGLTSMARGVMPCRPADQVDQAAPPLRLLTEPLAPHLYLPEDDLHDDHTAA